MNASVDKVASFWAKVKKTETCWLWTAGLTVGYGRLGDASRMLAHRFSYELSRGPIPAGLQIDHLCRNRACVNPAHLEPVTARINTLRGTGITAQEARTTHCPKGHPYDLFNTYLKPRGGGRDCRKCRNKASLTYHTHKRQVTADAQHAI